MQYSRKAEVPFDDNLYERFKLDYLRISDPAAYAEIVLNEEKRRYLSAVTQ